MGERSAGVQKLGDVAILQPQQHGNGVGVAAHRSLPTTNHLAYGVAVDAVVTCPAPDSDAEVMKGISHLGTGFDGRAKVAAEKACP